jgi:hypothetical protein
MDRSFQRGILPCHQPPGRISLLTVNASDRWLTANTINLISLLRPASSHYLLELVLLTYYRSLQAYVTLLTFKRHVHRYGLSQINAPSFYSAPGPGFISAGLRRLSLQGG